MAYHDTMTDSEFFAHTRAAIAESLRADRAAQDAREAAITARFALTMVSRNGKTGPIPVSTSYSDTCPDSCPLKGNGCYAAAGPLGMFWKKVDSGRAGLSWREFLAAVRTIRRGQVWRHNQAGDLPGRGDKLNRAMLKALVRAARGTRAYTYTHKPLESVADQIAVAEANAAGFIINLSANDLPHADKLAALDIGPVVVVLPRDTAPKAHIVTPAGRRVVVCPATYRDDITCAECKLCARLRDTIVGFPAHGVSAKRADAIARG